MTPSPRREFVRVASCLLIFGIYAWIRKKYRVLSGVGCYPTLLEIQARIRENVFEFVGFCWVLWGAACGVLGATRHIWRFTHGFLKMCWILLDFVGSCRVL